MEEKRALLTVSFGTAAEEARLEEIGGVEEALRRRVPELSFARAYTSPTIRRILANRGIAVPSLEEALEEQLAGCRQENSDLNDRLLRLRAEYDNFRKRSTKEKEGMFTDGVASALSQVVVVLDNLERAVDACQEDSDLKTGVEMTLKQFREVLEKMGVSEINPVGESFDAQLHNAVMHVEDETLGESQVVEVFQKGYLLGERVIRYAMVKVAN